MKEVKCKIRKGKSGGYDAVVLDCPFCHKQHIHSWGYINDHHKRRSHCWKGDYKLKDGAEYGASGMKDPL